MNLFRKIASLFRQDPARAMARDFRQLARVLSTLGESAKYAAVQLRELHRASLLFIRRLYVKAGKPYGNGYAPMMKWWRENHYQ
jgi:hypothetical protein